MRWSLLLSVLLVAACLESNPMPSPQGAGHAAPPAQDTIAADAGAQIGGGEENATYEAAKDATADLYFPTYEIYEIADLADLYEMPPFEEITADTAELQDLQQPDSLNDAMDTVDSSFDTEQIEDIADIAQDETSSATCDDGSQLTCDISPPQCDGGKILAVIEECYKCVYPETCSCDDGTEVLCNMVPPNCPAGTIVAVQAYCYVCVDPVTCSPVALSL